MEALSSIREAFAHRSLPMLVVRSDAPDTDEYDDARHFQGRTWESLTCAELDAHQDAMFGFSPEAFCYFLPGVLSAGIRENRPDLLVNTSLVMTLDRSNTPTSWDDFFAKRWPSLTAQECLAVQDWLLWLTEAHPHSVPESSLGRAFDTMQLLVDSATATPLAGRVPRS